MIKYQEIIQDLENLLRWKIERCIYARMSKCWELSFSERIHDDLEELGRRRKKEIVIEYNAM